MLRAILVSVATMALCSFAQSTWMQSIAILGAVPDLSLIVLVFVSIRNGSLEGQISGFISGIAQDMLSSAPLGLSSLTRAFLGFLLGKFHGNFFIDRLVAPFLLTLGATIAKAIAFSLASLVFGPGVHAYSFIEPTLWIETLYNAVAAPLLFAVLGLIGHLFTSERAR